jgi:alkylglycerol monooxygenase
MKELVFSVIYFAITLALVLLDTKFDRSRPKSAYNQKDTFLNFTALASNSLAGFVLGQLLVTGLEMGFGHMRRHEISINFFNFVSLLLAIDFMVYWVHRLHHRVRFFWLTHQVHHSSEFFNYSTAGRLSFVSELWLWAPYVVLWGVGFSYESILATLSVGAVYTFFLHSSDGVKINFGFLRYIFVTPADHAVHHGSNDEYIDRNFAAMFIFWDKLFNTYQPYTVTPIYGLKGQRAPSDFGELVLGPWVQFLNELKVSVSAWPKHSK